MKRIATALTLILAFLFLVLAGIQPVFFGSAATEGTGGVAASPHSILIDSPNNYTTYKNLMPLNFTVTWTIQDLDNLISWQYLTHINYSIDNKPPVTIARELMKIHQSIPFRINSSLDISELANGQHKIEVTARFFVNSADVILSTYDFSSAPVYFTVYNVPPPAIANLSLENKTYYSETNMPLSFTTDKKTSWIGYSLNGKENVTIYGNTTLTGLPDGSHTIVIYANDTLGNMGMSDTVFFTVNTVFIPAIIISGVIVVAAIGVLLYFKKRKR